ASKPIMTARLRNGVWPSSAQVTRRNAPSVAIMPSTPTTVLLLVGSRLSGRPACAHSTRPRLSSHNARRCAPEPRRSFMAQFALPAGAGTLSALAVVAFYGFATHAAPQLASSSTRSGRTVMVTPPAPPVTFDEGSGSAAPPTATAVVPAPGA